MHGSNGTAWPSWRSRHSERAAISASTGILAIGYFLGGNENLFSFVTMQGNRGLQVESVAATFWVWAAKAHLPGAGIYFDTALVTNQVSGSFTAEVSSLLGLVMVAALAITAWLSFNACGNLPSSIE